MKIGYLGPEASFSNEAAKNLFPNDELVPFASIPMVFDAIMESKVDRGVVPIENSTGGSVAVTLDELMENDFYITGEYFLKIKQCLMSKYPLKEIKKIYSHPQGLVQCKEWLKKNAKGIILAEASSTSRAAEKASQEEGTGAIASEIAAKLFGLNIIEDGINDMTSNETRFVIVSPTEDRANGDSKVSILFGVKDESGSLYKMLGIFEKHSLNMTKIESRPSKKGGWEYLFFVDFVGSTADENIKDAIKEMRQQSTSLRILGSYSRL